MQEVAEHVQQEQDGSHVQVREEALEKCKGLSVDYDWLKKEESSSKNLPNHLSRPDNTPLATPTLSSLKGLRRSGKKGLIDSFSLPGTD